MLKKISATVIVMSLMPRLALACACGCGVFDVGTASMLPTDSGGSVWLEYDLSNQSINWNGTSRASKDQNDDKHIHSDFITAGGQYMFTREWGVAAQVPTLNRNFKTIDGDAVNPIKVHSYDLGDIKLKGIYSGFSDDMSTGVTLGLKLPTGQFNAPGFDRDTQIGTGSTDMLLGAYHLGTFEEGSPLSWFINGQWQEAFSIQNNYRPGDETNIALGLYYNSGPVIGKDLLSPLFQVIGSNHLKDSGFNANPGNSGYTRMLVAPGLEYNLSDVKLYGDIEMPIYQNTGGNQLVASIAFKILVGYNF